jgi:large subunit ribosomal protein L20
MRATYGKARNRKKKRVFRQARGYWGARHRLWKTVKQSVRRGFQEAFRGRRQRKRDFRRLWILRVSAAARARGVTYSRLIAALRAAKVELNRKMLSEVAIRDPKAFDAILSQLKV